MICKCEIIMKRRKFIKTAAGLVAIPILTGAYAWQVEPFWLEFVHLPMKIRNLPDNLVGKTLMQISDMHVGERFPPSFLQKSLIKAQALTPDFVVYTGDFVSYENEKQLLQLKDVMTDAAHGELGTFAILGNHDYGRNWQEPDVATAIVGILEEADISVLRNEKVDVDGLNITGIDDFWGTNFDPVKALEQVDSSQANIVLCHNPDVADETVWEDYNSWILAGHTHGGQVKPPFLDPLILPVKNKNYKAGIIDLSWDRTLYINRALGHLWQVRFNVRPEITVFTMQRA